MLLFSVVYTKIKRKNVKKNYYWTLFFCVVSPIPYIHFLSFTFSSLSPSFLLFLLYDWNLNLNRAFLFLLSSSALSRLSFTRLQNSDSFFLPLVDGVYVVSSVCCKEVRWVAFWLMANLKNSRAAFFLSQSYVRLWNKSHLRKQCLSITFSAAISRMRKLINKKSVMVVQLFFLDNVGLTIYVTFSKLTEAKMTVISSMFSYF